MVRQGKELETYFLDSELKYDGKQILSHWAYKQFKINDDSIIAFCGECDISVENMIDLEDVINNERIYSPLMLNFIIEHFNCSLREIVLRQYNLASIIKDVILEFNPKFTIRREGSDIYFEDKKMTISVATAGVISSKIHFGINIKTQGVPVPAVGLEDAGIDPVDYAEVILKRYKEDYLKQTYSLRKVREI